MSVSYSNPDPLDVYFYPLATDEFPLWALRQAKILFPDLNDNIVSNKHIIYRDIDDLTKIAGSSVIVVGGGPTTHALTIDDYLKYDFVFSMNSFFKHSVLKNIRVDIAGVGAGVNLVDPTFQSYLKKFNPILAFELHPDWYRMNRILATFYNKARKMFYHTKFYGQIGMGARMVNLAASLGAKTVSFIGFDGPKAILKGQHAFEQGKTQLPSFCTPENADEIHKKHYHLFWEYITNLYPGTTFISIDQCNEYHKLCIHKQL